MPEFVKKGGKQPATPPPAPTGQDRPPMPSGSTRRPTVDEVTPDVMLALTSRFSPGACLLFIEALIDAGYDVIPKDRSPEPPAITDDERVRLRNVAHLLRSGEALRPRAAKEIADLLDRITKEADRD